MTEEKDESLIVHLEALRTVLIRCFLALGIAFVPCFYIAPYLLSRLMKVIAAGQDISFNYFSPMEVFFLQIKMAFFLDVIVCFPYIARRVWEFVLPALYENEQRFIRSVVFISAFLFCGGALFCLFVIMPIIIRFGLSFSTQEIKPMWGLMNVISFSFWLSVVFGIMFQFPLITVGLIRNGFVRYEAVCQKRPFVFVGILILSALLTPPDIISQVLLTLPTYGLFELGLLFSKRLKL